MTLYSDHDPDDPADAPAVSALLPWFGSKRTLAPVIVEELGPHHTYFEPFCGSMAVLFAKPAARMECVNDLHGDLVNLARVIQSPTLGAALYRRARRSWMCETTMREAAARWKQRGVTPAGDMPDLDRAFDFFYTSWVGRNGVSGTSSYNQGFAMRYTPSGGHGGRRWQSAVSSIPAWRRRMANLTITNRCGMSILDKIDDAVGAAVYLDPPYLVKGAAYVHDFHADDHARLAGAAARFRRARVVVSYYDHPRLAELYPGWTVRHCPITKAMTNERMRGHGAAKKIAPEVLLLNGPSFAAHGAGLWDAMPAACGVMEGA